jgi:IS30 family transposase
MGGSLFRHLHCQKKCRKRYGGYDQRGQLPNRVSIEKRPAIVEQRLRIGDWKVDTMVGKRCHQAIVALIEYKSRFAMLRKIEQRSDDQVCNAMADLLQPTSDHLHTTTADNGKEFAEREKSLDR